MKRTNLIIALIAAITLLGAIWIFAKADPCVDGNPIVSIGSSAQCGSAGPAGPPTMGTPNSRSLSLATAYQATDPTKLSVFTITITSTANFSLSGGTTNTAKIVVGPTNAVASGTGTTFGNYANSIAGTIAVGLNMNSAQTFSYTVFVPPGYYIAILQTSGTVSISSAFDQSVA